MEIKQEFRRITIIAHGGASNRFYSKEQRELKLATVIGAVLEGAEVIQKELEALPTVETVIKFMENSGNLNSGAGSVKQQDGKQRMDASIMGSDLRFGGVVQLEGFAHPIAVARKILEKRYDVLQESQKSEELPDHILFENNSAQKIAESHQISKMDTWKQPSLPADLQSFLEEKIGLENLDRKSSEDYPEDELDTVGCVVLGYNGDLCAGTSTGGRGQCLPGRIGDSPLIGAGTYCNKKCGVSMTGFGENIAQLCCAKRIVDQVYFDQIPVQVALEKTLREYEDHFDTSVGSIAIDNEGEFAVGMNAVGMSWAAISFLLNVDGIVFERKLFYGTLKNEKHEITF